MICNKIIDNNPLGMIYNPILEMTMINYDKETFPYGAFVYGNGFYNPDGEPHFFYFDDIDGSNEWYFIIQIPTVAQWEQSKELYIIESFSNDLLNEDKVKALIKWLDEMSMKFPLYSNLEVIRHFWNTLNSDDKNISHRLNI